MSINLYDALKSSYGDKRSKEQLRNAGFNYDSMLSNHNQQVWFNPNSKKLLYNVAGTHNLSDWGTDLWLALGGLKNTDRYKEASKILDEAKRKYGYDVQTSITGHSLGGSIAQYIAGKNDKVYTLDKGATIGQKTRSNENAYRTTGDLVSALNANSTRMKTLKNNTLPTGSLASDIYNAHDVNNIKDEGIFID